MPDSLRIEEVVLRAARLCKPAPISTSSSSYVSGFTKWNGQASVRVKERQLVTTLATEEDEGKVFFPAAMVPVLQHHIVKSCGAEISRQLQIMSLHSYLEFTAELEQCVVNPITSQISRGRFGIPVPLAM